MRFFISYCHHNREEVSLATFLAREIQAAGHHAFIDSSMPLGTDWGEEISTQIANCDRFVVLLSESTLSSEMVRAEVRRAHQRRKREGFPEIFPVRVRYFEDLGYELEAQVGQFQQARWEEDRDSQGILDGILGASPLLLSVEPLPPRPNLQDPRRPQPKVDPRAFSAPGAAVRPDDPLYIQRGADTVAVQRAQSEGETVFIKAPRQMGKSSLLLRYLGACRKEGKKIAFLDFSMLTENELKDYETLLSDIAAVLVRQLDLAGSKTPFIRRQIELTHFMEDNVRPILSGGVVLAFDEVDRVLGRPYQKDFFALLRSWSNNRALAPDFWGRIDLALVISTEPYLLVHSPYDSPFLVGTGLVLDTFSIDHCRQLNDLYGTPLSLSEVEQLYEFLAGHPYLTRLSFYRMIASDPLDFSTLMDRAWNGREPFEDHLRALSLKLGRQKGSIAALRRIILGSGDTTGDAYLRLRSAGLVRDNGNTAIPANLLYARFFRNAL